MEPTTNLDVSVKTNDMRATIVPTAHRDPTPLDWERWAPRIAARYKSVPALVLIGEMDAEGLRVTEKMLRDRLRQWGMNDKNRRSAANQRRRDLQPANNRNRSCTQYGSRHQTAYNSSSQSQLHIPSIPIPPNTPKDFRNVQQALKSMQDWQAHFKDSGYDQIEILQRTDSFFFLLRDVSVALRFDRSDSSMCGKATRKLRAASAAFGRCLGPMCTPIAVLSSIQLILMIVKRRDTDAWYELTSKFLLQIVTETLPMSHPTTLLLQALLLRQSTAEGLALIYEVGSTLIQLCHSKSTAINFRLDFLSAALDIFPEASFATETDVICQNFMKLNDLARRSYRVKRNVSLRRSDELVTYSMRCTAAVTRDRPTRSLLSSETTTMQERKTDYYAWRILCNSQRMQCGFAGEEISRLNAHAVIATMSDPRGGPRFSPTSVFLLRKLHKFYKKHDLVEQCQALHLEYPDAFEL